MAIIESADQAAALVLNLAMHAADQGTFAVGGAIICNETGAVVQAMHNNVLKPLTNKEAFTYDPTAHGERQLVYWYYENRQELGLPEPSKLTVVTSLDPCAMCTGALLTAGFNVGVVAFDDYAGINYDGSFKFLDLPESLRQVAKDKFGYYAAGRERVDPPLYTRSAYQGGDSVKFQHTKMSSSNLMGCGAVFADSSNMVRHISSANAGKAPGAGLLNPADLPDSSPIKLRYRAIYPKAFRISTPDPRIPGPELIAELEQVASAGKERDGDGNAVAFIDPFGNVVLCMAGREKVAPVYAPFMEVTQNYARTRWDLMNNESTRQVTSDYLTSPKYGTFLFLHAPDPDSAPGIMTLGAYGSTMEGPLPQIFPSNLQYVNGPKPGTLLDLTEVIMNLPPFYTELVQLAIAPSPGVSKDESEVATPEALARLAGTLGQRRKRPEHQLARHRPVYLNKSRLS